jgi:hypothetical protein
LSDAESDRNARKCRRGRGAQGVDRTGLPCPAAIW